MSTNEVQKVPLFVEIIGEPAVGKTHLSCLFPKPAVIDTTASKESYIILRKLFPAEWKKRFFPVWNLENIRKALEEIIKNKEMYRTVVIDTSADLRDFAADEYLAELNKQGKNREAVMPKEYKWVNQKIDRIIDKAKVIPKPDTKDMEKYLQLNLVFVSQMKDEWSGEKPTGKRIRKGYPNANFQSDIRLFLQMESVVDLTTMRTTGKFKRKCLIVKNRFKDQASEAWVSELDPINWSGIITKLTDLKEGEIVE
jgi:hypothetical protein